MALYGRLSDNTPSPQSIHSSSRTSKDPNGPSLVEAFGGITKKRAAKACNCCRKRKVRCDVSDFGLPCSNCRFDKASCTIKESRRNRRRTLTTEDDDAVLGWKIPTAIRDPRNATLSRSGKDLNGVDIEDASTPTLHDLNDEDLHVPHLIYQRQEQKGAHKATYASIEPHQTYQLPPQILYRSAPEDFVEGFFPLKIKTQFPKAITISPVFHGLPSRITQEDVEYLSAKGALSIPEPNLRNQLIRSYIEHVHSHMPIIDLHEFVDILERGDGSTGQLSLLLFQCVMFAGSAFIELEHLRAFGFATRFEARKALFTKVRVLYDLDCENDRITLVQSLLLMTHWYEKPDDQKDLWYWTGVVSSLSLRIGLHTPYTDSRIDIRRRKLYKRIGWACFIRDQLVTLGTQRPARIKSREHTLPVLSLSDFDLEPVSEKISCVISECAVARDSQQLRSLAGTIVELSKLSLCIARVLETQYAMIKDDAPEMITGNIRFLLPKSNGPESRDVRECDAELQKWQNECMAAARHTPISIDDEIQGQEPLIVHRALLDMIFYATVIMLHRPLATSTDSGAQKEARQRSAIKVQDAAFAMTRNAQGLLTHGLILFMPSHGPTVILQAIMVHLVASTSTDSTARAASIEGFKLCMKVLHFMRETHNGAKVLICLIEQGMKRRGAFHAPTFPRSPSQSESQDQIQVQKQPPSQLKSLSTSQGEAEAQRARHKSASSESSDAELMAVLGARTYIPPVRRELSSYQTAAPDPRLLLESSGLMVDENLFGGWDVAKVLLQRKFGVKEAERAIEMAEQDEQDDWESRRPEVQDVQTEDLHVLTSGQANFMEYVEQMADFELDGDIGEEIYGHNNGKLDAAAMCAVEEGLEMDIDVMWTWT